MEEKLRFLSSHCDAHVLAFYDECRSDLKSFLNLSRGAEQSNASLFADNIPYMHLCTQPLKVVDAKSQLAEQAFGHLTAKVAE